MWGSRRRLLASVRTSPVVRHSRTTSSSQVRTLGN
jgi:hypothetical protein